VLILTKTGDVLVLALVLLTDTCVGISEVTGLVFPLSVCLNFQQRHAEPVLRVAGRLPRTEAGEL